MSESVEIRDILTVIREVRARTVTEVQKRGHVAYPMYEAQVASKTYLKEQLMDVAVRCIERLAALEKVQDDS